MGASVSLSRALSLRAPIANEAERAHFQKRLAQTLVIVFCLAFAFWLVSVVMVAFVVNADLAYFLATPTVNIQLATTFAAGAGALVLSRGKRSVAQLGVADVVITVLLGIGWVMMTFCERGSEGYGVRAELIPLLASSYTLATRAALVPSTAGRSAVVGAATLAPLLPATYWMHRFTTPGVGSFGHIVYIAMWALLGISCTATISHVIYGLRLEVRKATQLGQYLLEDKLGEGGMGTVYRASHKMLRRPCAIKLLTKPSRTATERFEREVQITALLTHPNTVAVFDYGRTPDGVFYYAMEYLDGVTLEDLVEELGPQSAPRVVHILGQICGALEEAHGRGLVHRDIKPANVMLTERGGVPDVVKVLDFGLVKELETSDPGTSTMNAILGTPHYMAPEAITDASNIDARADLYAVGATAYYLLTGKHVFEGTTLLEVCSQHLHQAPVAPSMRNPDVPAMLEALVLECLAKKAAQRPADAGALAKRLRECDVAAWTRDDARAWWTDAAPKLKKSAARTREATTDTARLAAGDTVAVALDDRGGP